MSIQERQNRPESLNKIAAQSLLYTRSKRVRNWRMILVTMVVCALILSAAVGQSEVIASVLSIFAVGTWLLDRLVLNRLECELRAEAATIQEDFDCFVLDLRWPSIKGVRRPMTERVSRLAEIARCMPGASYKVDNWYKIDGIPTDPFAAKIHCQKMNCTWDLDLRRAWILVFQIVVWSAVLLAAILLAITEITVGKVAAMAALSIRLMAWYVDETQAQIVAVEEMGRIYSYLSGESCEKPRDICDVRSVQDVILEHRRSTPPVPDWLYRRSKDRLEDAWY